MLQQKMEQEYDTLELRFLNPHKFQGVPSGRRTFIMSTDTVTGKIPEQLKQDGKVACHHI
jgi:hypothetical protein